MGTRNERWGGCRFTDRKSGHFINKDGHAGLSPESCVVDDDSQEKWEHVDCGMYGHPPISYKNQKTGAWWKCTRDRNAVVTTYEDSEGHWEKNTVVNYGCISKYYIRTCKNSNGVCYDAEKAYKETKNYRESVVEIWRDDFGYQMTRKVTFDDKQVYVEECDDEGYIATSAYPDGRVDTFDERGNISTRKLPDGMVLTAEQLWPKINISGEATRSYTEHNGDIVTESKKWREPLLVVDKDGKKLRGWTLRWNGARLNYIDYRTGYWEKRTADNGWWTYEDSKGGWWMKKYDCDGETLLFERSRSGSYFKHVEPKEYDSRLHQNAAIHAAYAYDTRADERSHKWWTAT